MNFFHKSVVRMKRLMGKSHKGSIKGIRVVRYHGCDMSVRAVSNVIRKSDTNLEGRVHVFRR